MVEFTPSWIAAPILAQRNIELAEIVVSHNSFNRSTVFAIRATDDTIAFFEIASVDMAAARNIEEVRALIEPHFHTVEFTSGQPAISEIQPAITEPDPAVDQSPAETLSDEGATCPAIDADGGSKTPADIEGQEQQPGQPIEPVDRGGE